MVSYQRCRGDLSEIKVAARGRTGPRASRRPAPPTCSRPGPNHFDRPRIPWMNPRTIQGTTQTIDASGLTPVIQTTILIAWRASFHTAAGARRESDRTPDQLRGKASPAPRATTTCHVTPPETQRSAPAPHHETAPPLPPLVPKSARSQSGALGTPPAGAISLRGRAVGFFRASEPARRHPRLRNTVSLRKGVPKQSLGTRRAGSAGGATVRAK